VIQENTSRAHEYLVNTRKTTSSMYTWHERSQTRGRGVLSRIYVVSK